MSIIWLLVLIVGIVLLALGGLVDEKRGCAVYFAGFLGFTLAVAALASGRYIWLLGALASFAIWYFIFESSSDDGNDFTDTHRGNF